MTRRETAVNYFKEGYNCAQAVLLTFCDMTGLTEEQSALIASSFGGGMGKLREVCGAVSGMLMAAGLIMGYSDPHDRSLKIKHYKLVQELAAEFKERGGSIICRELLASLSKQELDINTPPAERTEEYYKKRPCARHIGDAAEILEIYLCKNADI